MNLSWTARTVGTLMLGLAGGLATTDAHAADKPDVIVVLIDTLRNDRTSLYGYELETTPFIDSISKQGAVFEQANSTGSHTAPTTASIFTSLFPLQHGITLGFFALQRNQFEVADAGRTMTTLATIPKEVTTMPEAFQAAGYKTFGVAGNVNICDELGFSSGFDQFKLFDDQDPKTHDAPRAHVLVDQLLAWDKQIRGPEPVFVYMHFMDPHAPHQQEKPWMDGFRKATAGKGSQPVVDAAYASEIAYTDDQIKRAFEHFGWSRDAIVVFVADHGEEYGDHGGRGHGSTLYQEVTDVMFSIRGPGVKPQRVKDPVSMIDVLPTLASVAGVPAASEWAGLDLSGRLKSGANTANWSRKLAERPMYATVRRGRDTKKPVHSVVLGQKKLIGADGSWELYDRASDKREQKNLASSRTADVKALSALVQKYLDTPPVSANSSVEVELDAEEMEQLRQLGYVE